GPPPSLKEVLNPPRSPQPPVGGRLARSPPHQHAEVRPGGLVDGVKCLLVGYVVAEKRNWPAPAGFAQDLTHRPTFIAAHSQLQAGLELQQRQAFHLRQRFEKTPRLLFDLAGLPRWNPPPVHHH